MANRPGVISLAGGLPSVRHFPIEETSGVVAELLHGDAGTLQYSSTEGDAGLREWVAARHGARVDQVLITHGSQQALDLIARVALDVGDQVALADPGYIGAIQAMRLSGARLVAVATDDDGLAVEDLEQELRGGARPRLVYVVPNFHNPTGATLSASRARLLAELADHFGFLIVEDDPYGEIRFGGTAPPPLATLTDKVATVGTISKVLFPGLRVGWIVAPPSLAPSLALVKQAVDLHTATLNQRVALRLLTRPDFLARHVAILRTHYAQQSRILADALRTELGDVLDVTTPAGGMFLWARVRPPGVDTEALLPRAIDHGVAYVPGSAFSVERPHRSSLRLSFATVPPEELAEGARRLAAVVLDRRDRSRPGSATATTYASTSR
ncbi:MAG TPA: PLP-dependent aminotransferase family protein [Acidimicrobiales bacterium]